MLVVNRQIHGYRQGHQLLCGSILLPREDQSTIDRLSDVAGPLRPREHFNPYLTCYQLPSKEFYVLARTWQDPTVARAGCVRTLSLIVASDEWEAVQDTSAVFAILDIDRLPTEADSGAVSLQLGGESRFSPAPAFNASELMESLFLEDARPVVIFDAPNPDEIAKRLVAALWPSARRQFSVSTFALSPRKVSGSDFNLVFAPKDARSKFSDWPGRRVDGRLSKLDRHRWTSLLVDRVFDSSVPRLLPPSGEILVKKKSSLAANDNASELRIAMLWGELWTRLDSSPVAALGLLDIANSGKVWEEYALSVLDAPLVRAIGQASSTLPVDDAWDFVGALINKFEGRSISSVWEAVKDAVVDLTRRSPEGSIDFLLRMRNSSVIRDLLSAIAYFLSANFSERTERSLLSAPMVIVAGLVSQSPSLARCTSDVPAFIHKFNRELPGLDESTLDSVRVALLPFLIGDWQLPAAAPLLDVLNGQQLVAEIQHLGMANDFAATEMVEVCLTRAQQLGVRSTVLSVLSMMGNSEGRNLVLARALRPDFADFSWLFQESKLPSSVVHKIANKLIVQAHDDEIVRIVSGLNDRGVHESAMSGVPGFAARVVSIDSIRLSLAVPFFEAEVSRLNYLERARVAERALLRSLGASFGGDEVGFIVRMLDGMGGLLDGVRISGLALSRRVEAPLAGRNLVAFRRSSDAARTQLVSALAEMAGVIRARERFDLGVQGADAFAALVAEAEVEAPHEALSASARLLPMVIEQRNYPVSSLIVAMFPVVYRELVRKEGGTERLAVMPFLARDRARAARLDIVSAYLFSSWPPSDLALLACRCAEEEKILRVVARATGGAEYLELIKSSLDSLPESCQTSTERAIKVVSRFRTSKK
ncbi:hypothetical protein DAIF1_18440 [Stenotrophomonas indicatrix]|nr:hypothetical protein DAIF1_18440 [Stenotrophomonas indicatrix]